MSAQDASSSDVIDRKQIGIDAIHLITHGSQAGLQLGTATKSYV